MEGNLQHEDLLIKLRAILNESKIKLWEPPYYDSNLETTSDLQSLATKYSTALSTNVEETLQALRELQIHSLERSQANEEFKESGLATIRVRAMLPGIGAKMVLVQKKLNVMTKELFAAIANDVGVDENRLKLIFNGKVLKTDLSLEDQGIKNGSQLMALVLTESPEEVRQEESMYMEMKSTRDDAMLLSGCVDVLSEDDEYMKIEDQSGKPVELPPAERRALLVGLALHERGRTALRDQQYPLALILLLEADNHLSSCRSSLLELVDNWAVLQLDVAWCYLCLRALPAAAAEDAARRLPRAELRLRRSYGDDLQRLVALKGTAANERVLFLRLYLLQGIVAYHQNKRDEAKALLDKAETELDALRVDEEGVSTLTELGWSCGEARAGLRAAAGDLARAHHYLERRRAQRRAARRQARDQRRRRSLGVCADGAPVSAQLVDALVGMGFERRTAVVALRNTNNHVAEAVRLIQDQPEMLVDSVESSEEMTTPSSEESLVEPDENLVTELQALGYAAAEARRALRLCANRAGAARDLLAGAPSTSAAPACQRAERREKRKKKLDAALERLSSGIRTEEDDHLDTSLVQEEQFLAQYRSLL